jgi:hypothetical protein
MAFPITGAAIEDISYTSPKVSKVQQSCKLTRYAGYGVSVGVLVGVFVGVCV